MPKKKCDENLWNLDARRVQGLPSIPPESINVLEIVNIIALVPAGMRRSKLYPLNEHRPGRRYIIVRAKFNQALAHVEKQAHMRKYFPRVIRP